MVNTAGMGICSPVFCQIQRGARPPGAGPGEGLPGSLIYRNSILPLDRSVNAVPMVIFKSYGTLIFIKAALRVALLRFRGESTHESVAVPKLNVVVINELFGRFNGGGIVRGIVQKFGSNEIEMPVDTDDVGAIVRQCCCSLDQAGAQNSQSPIKAAGGSVMGDSEFALCSVVD